MAAIAFVMAAGVLTFVTVHQFQRERAVPVTTGGPPPQFAPNVESAPRISPTTLLGAAREDTGVTGVPLPQSDPLEEPPVAATPTTAVVERKSVRAKQRPNAIRAPAVVEPAEPLAPAEPIVATAPPAAVPAAPPQTVTPDREQQLAAALGRCGANGGFFARVGCEHDARARYCAGQWGKLALCPGGVGNDHGQ